MDEASKEGGKQANENVVQDAVNETGFGKFNLKVAAISNLMYLNVAFSVASIGIILPAAACDFKMTTVDKGRLSAAPMLGMACGSYAWGCYAALKGRKRALLVALFLHGISEFLASFIPFYWVFITLKFFNGVALIGQITVVFLYLAEFQPTNYRKRVLAWMELFWVSGMLVLAGVAWIIIPLNVSFKVSTFTFHSWNIFVMICSFPALIIGTWLVCFPETPKYLAETGQNMKMLNVLSRMYTENTGESPKEYIAKLKRGRNNSLVEFVTYTIDVNDARKIEEKSFRQMIKVILTQTISILKPPFLKRTILMSLISYFIMSAFYSLTLWLPEIFHRYADFEKTYPNRSARVCTLSPKNETDALSDDPFGCHTKVESTMFVHTFILGASCIPTGLILPVTVYYIGYKWFLVLATATPGIVALCLFLVQTSVQNLIISCIFEAVISMAASVISCILVELYPTHLSAMAAGLSGLFGRIGSLSGNLLMGYLIDDYCVSLIIIVATQLLASAILALFIPGKENREKLKSSETTESTAM